jgi:hypothetical protein
MLKQFPLQIGKVQKRVEMLIFLGRTPLRNEFEGFKSRESTCTEQNTSFELSNVRISPDLRPASEMRKRKKCEKVHKTVAFNRCVTVPPVNRSQPNVVYL